MSTKTATQRTSKSPQSLSSRSITSSPSNNGKTEMIVTSLLLGFAAVFILNRLYLKTCIVRKFTLDDLTILIAMFGATAHYAAGIIGIQNVSMGTYDWLINIAQDPSKDVQIPVYLLSILQAFEFLFVKLTFFIMYRQVFGPMRWMRIGATIGAVLSTLFYTSFFVCGVIFSTPRRGETWTQHQTSAVEWLNFKLSIPQSCVNLIFDIYILILPIVAVAKLQMTPRRKIGVILIFMTGLLACLGSILSIYYRVQFERSLNNSWAVVSVVTTSLLETFVGIICACMPAAVGTHQHHLPSFDSFRKSLRTRYGSRSLKAHEVDTSYLNSTSNDVKTSRGAHEGYLSLDLPELPITVPTRSLNTIIHSEGSNNADHDGIHLTYEMQQTSASPSAHNLRWTAV